MQKCLTVLKSETGSYIVAFEGGVFACAFCCFDQEIIITNLFALQINQSIHPLTAMMIFGTTLLLLYVQSCLFIHLLKKKRKK